MFDKTKLTWMNGERPALTDAPFAGSAGGPVADASRLQNQFAAIQCPPLPLSDPPEKSKLAQFEPWTTFHALRLQSALYATMPAHFRCFGPSYRPSPCDVWGCGAQD